MAIRNVKGEVTDLIRVKNVLVSVYDKTGLESLIPGLIDLNPKVAFISTGGTYSKVKEILGSSHSQNLMEVAEYTGFPEMEGGLVKTLHPKIHAGILGERNNPEHQRYLEQELGNGVFIDMVVANLYPFQDVINSGVDFEKARGNIDIGGPTMIRGAAKNFLSCAVVCDPVEYKYVLNHIAAANGTTSFSYRFHLAQKAFKKTAEYDKAISDHLSKKYGFDLSKIRESYNLGPEVYMD